MLDLTHLPWTTLGAIFSGVVSAALVFRLGRLHGKAIAGPARRSADARALLRAAIDAGYARLAAALMVAILATSVLTLHALSGDPLFADSAVPLLAFAVPLVALYFALAAFIAWVLLLRREQRDGGWQTVQGRIVNAAVAFDQTTGADGRRTVKYRPDIRFEYRIGAKLFRSSGWKRGWAALDTDVAAARETVARYGQGRDVTVYYHPQWPERGVLEPHRLAGAATPLMFSGLFSTAGILFFWAFASLH